MGIDVGGTPCDIFSLQDECTPLIVASGMGHVEWVKLLLDRGAHVNHQDKVSAVLISDNCNGPFSEKVMWSIDKRTVILVGLILVYCPILCVY